MSEVEATTASSPPVLVAERRKFLQLRRRRLKLPGGEGSFSLTSPASGSRCFMLVRMWVMCLVRERFSAIDLKGFEASPSDEISIERRSSPTSVQEGEEESWFRRRLEGIMSSGETRVSVIWHDGLVRRRRSGRGGVTRGVLTEKISTRVFL
ncbi:hypothetical protein DY000_02026298 [Brassica cretica]|uniref:Uncharacterized protein n=1 Tax=Brassica cretica TaxID=69181 RepID=A0ABQ7EL95_BRACR|nr:hypothetical protein DY000_02026298 [Brassica cretica]